MRALGLLLLVWRAPAWAASTAPVTAEAWIARGHAFYFRGEPWKAVGSYEAAIKLSSAAVAPWVNGAAVLEELGEPAKAVRWYERAAALGADPAVLNALGWARFRARRLPAARETFRRVLRLRPDDPYALFGLARVQLASSRPLEALELLKRTAEASPLLNLTFYFLGKTYEQVGDRAKTLEAYGQGINADSYFLEARDALGRAYLRQRSFNQAWRQFSRILDAEPKHSRIHELVRRLQPLLTRRPAELRTPGPRATVLGAPAWDADPRVPVIRAAIGTTALGKPRARAQISFSATGPYAVLDARTGARLGGGDADEFWTVKLKRLKKGLGLELVSPSGRMRLVRREPVLVRPDGASGFVAVTEAPIGKGTGGAAAAERLLRGALEVAAVPSRRTLRLVNVVDLESYTHGVLAAEMPIRSPLEALKAQAILARSHALYIKRVSQRHKKDGYDVCDEQHCQVYAGLRAESERSRSVVEGTRGVIATFAGRVAHVIYSSNCGGHTQSGSDLTGWGSLPYWKGVPDGADLGPRPDSPWELRRWLTTFPPAYCRPSPHVHPAHFRWTRLVPFRDIEAKVRRRYKIGKLLGLRPLRRSPAGNVNALLVRGTRRSVTVDSEMTIRGLLGVGSIRSTLFVFDVEYGATFKPETLVFHGGGWGHGVGLCQSGAMGRAEAGQTAEQIVSAYFQGVELTRLPDY